ncbi:hypothetical protein pb186bvf_016925 [Paramecium bursaria]
MEFEEEVLKQGVRESPQEGDEVYCKHISFKIVFFCTKDQNDNLIAGSQFSATKCVIGRGQINANIENALKLMKQGQRSVFKVFPNPANKKDQFYVHELEIIRYGGKANKPWQLDGQQRYVRALELKNEGNQSIKGQSYKDAQNLYSEGLKLIKSDYGEREQELQIQIRSNLSLTALKNKQYELCVEQASKVLEQNPRNIKLLHRRAVANIELGEFEQARNDLQQALHFDPNNVEIKTEIDQLVNKEKIIKKKQQDRAKKMLFGE